jgi:hypothetical protein
VNFLIFFVFGLPTAAVLAGASAFNPQFGKNKLYQADPHTNGNQNAE